MQHHVNIQCNIVQQGRQTKGFTHFESRKKPEDNKRKVVSNPNPNKKHTSCNIMQLNSATSRNKVAKRRPLHISRLSEKEKYNSQKCIKRPSFSIPGRKPRYEIFPIQSQFSQLTKLTVHECCINMKSFS